MKNGREFVIIGNWKMNKTISEARNFIETLEWKNFGMKIGLAVPYTALFSVCNFVKEKKYSLMIGAQNMHEKTQGAFTGEISSLMLKDIGVEFVLLGHSERRHLFHESDERIHQKILCALQENIRVILCIGETLEEKKVGKTKEVIKRQLNSALEKIDDITLISLAYEPVWAIGTGIVAQPEEVQKVHMFCRSEIANLFGKDSAEKLIIQYGGSVQEDNAHSLVNQADIDGLLIGGASLNVDSFRKIIQKCSFCLNDMV